MNPKTIMLAVSRGLLEHRDRMGPAIWELLWLVDKVTEDVPDGAGKFHGVVLGGQAVSLGQIAKDLNEHVDTTKRNVKRLESQGYIIRQRLPENRCAYLVTNSKKWYLRDRREGENAPARQGENALTREGENAPAKPGAVAKMHPAQVQECTHREGINAPANKETLQDSTKNSTKSKGAARPTFEEVAAYCQERQNHVDPERWLNYYTSNGWKVGRNPMMNWKAAVRTWEKNGMNGGTSNGNGSRRPSEGLVHRSTIQEDPGACSTCGGEQRVRRQIDGPGPRTIPCPACSPQNASTGAASQ